MDESPSSGAFEHWVLENPWPLAVALALAAIVIAKFAFDRSSTRMLSGALAAAALAVAVLAAGWFVTTPGEHAAAVVASFVRAAEAGDTNAMHALVAPEASIHFGGLRAPGLDRAEIDRGIDAIGSRHRIERNTVSRLRGATVSGDEGVGDLACVTTTASSFGPVPSAWLFRVRRQENGRWLIEQIACTSIAGRAPGSRPW